MACSSSAAPQVTVIIVNYNSGQRLAKCLDHLAMQSFLDFETIIIDNNSQDGSADSAAGHKLKPGVINANKNLGFAVGNNQAAAIARGKWLAFLNPDAYAEKNWLRKLIDATLKYPFADAFGSTQIDAGDATRIDGAGDVCHAFGLAYRGAFGWPVSEHLTDGLCFSPCAAAALYRRDVFDALGGFDERFFCYGEDVDLGFRLRLSGGECVQVSDAVVNHEGSGVTGRYSDFSVYYGNRNRIWLYYKNLPPVLYWLLAPVHLLINISMWARAALSGRGGAYWRAMRDGYGDLSSFRMIRKDVQNSRKVSTMAIAKLLTWSPVKLMRRQTDLRPIFEGQANQLPIILKR